MASTYPTPAIVRRNCSPPVGDYDKPSTCISTFVGDPHSHSVNNDDAVYLLHPTARATVVCVPTNVTEEKLKAIADKYCQELDLEKAAISWHMNSSHFTIFPHGAEQFVRDCHCNIYHDPVTPFDPAQKHSNYLLCSGDDEADLLDTEYDDVENGSVSLDPTARLANPSIAPQAQVGEASATAQPHEDATEEEKPYIKRPPNAWILYNIAKFDEVKAQNPGAKAGTITKIISEMWKNETPNAKAHYVQLSREKSEEHKKLFPVYSFRDFYGKAKGKRANRHGVTVGETNSSRRGKDAAGPAAGLSAPDPHSHECDNGGDDERAPMNAGGK